MKLNLWLAPLALFCAVRLFAIPVGYVQVSSSNLNAGNGLISNATIYWLPVNNNVQTLPGFHIGASSGGQQGSQPFLATVTSGAFTVIVPDTYLSSPQNVCYNVTVTDNQSGTVLLSYPCVQPASSGQTSWCTTVSGSTTCNFDAYIPSLPGNTVVATGPPGPQGIAGTNCASGSSPSTCIFNGSLDATYMNASVNGVINAASQTGADWVAKVAAAIALVPTSGGTVFVPTSLAGSGTGGITVPAGVSLQFDCAAFAMSGAITLNSGTHLLGCTSGSTTLQFTGATDGLVVAQASPVNKFIVIENIGLVTTNASGGAAWRADGPTITAVTWEMRSVWIATSGSGAWAYGMHLNGAQFFTARDVWITGATNVGIHAENSVTEALFENVFIVNTNGARGLEMFSGVINGDEIFWVGGGIQGTFSGSAIYMLTNASQAQNYLYISAGMHIETNTNTPSDGAAVVCDGCFLRLSGAAIENSIETLATHQTPVVNISDSTVGPLSFVSGTFGSVEGTNYSSLSNSSSNMTLAGNSTWGGGAVNILQIGAFSAYSNNGSARTDFSQGATNVFSMVDSTWEGLELDSTSANFAWSDTYLSRPSSGVVQVGTTPGSANGGFVAATFTAGSNVVYRCTTAGTLPVGALTITTADCGASVVTGFSAQ